MARLNEGPAPAESHLELLRRKFLRQNRDIAKINSDQSQKIRRLENDCARLLSENLDLRGQILRLKKQLEDNNAQRIADHALEVKARLEVQLSEFAALLGSLGVEPPAKRRASRDREMTKPRQSMHRSPPHRRRRDTADAEALAEQEGRLPPIYENKTYPRATMNSEEILALCAAAADTSDSPDLGPPPVSRYVEDEPVKHSPARPVEIVIPESPRRSPAVLSPPKLDYCRKVPSSPEPTKEVEEIAVEASPIKAAVPALRPAPQPAPQPVRAGAKRKYGDENGTLHSVPAQAGKENAIVEKTFPVRGGHKRKSVAEPSGDKPEKKTTRTPLGPKRTPLAAKSTNDDASSPRKQTKAAPLKESKQERARPLNIPVMKDDAEARRPVAEIVVMPEPPAVAHLLETATALPSAAPSSPTTPERPAQKQEMLHDTPPPADISSTGETTRPSRRARPAISYAEPNLRDKMRRPTKELFDAVTGEGKYAHRASISKTDEHHPAPISSSKPKSEMGSSAKSHSQASTVGNPPSKAQEQVLLSPLAQKDVFSDVLPSTVVTERRKRPSAAGGRESLAASERADSANRDPSPAEATTHTVGSRHKAGTAASTKPSSDEKQHQPSPTATSAHKPDIYDFTASSPSTSTSISNSVKSPSRDTNDHPHANLAPAPAPAPAPSTTHITTTTTRPRTARKSSMAAAAALRHLLDEEEAHDNDKTTVSKSSSSSRSAHARGKRASMIAAPTTTKKGSMSALLDGDGGEEDADTSGASMESGSEVRSGSGSGSAREGRVARRRSMML